MSGSGLDESGNWKPAFAGQREPFRHGHTASVHSGFWMNPMLRPDDRAEVEEIKSELRPLLPIYREEFEVAIEQLACRLWRQRRAYKDLSEHGIVRNGEPAPVLGHLAKLESAISKDLDRFGLNPRAAVALGLDLIRCEAAKLTVTRLAALAADDEQAA